MTTIARDDLKAARSGQQVLARTAAGDHGETEAPRLTSDQVWHEIAQASFAVLGYVTPSGEPRSSGVVYMTLGRHLYVAVAPTGWKARHIAASGKVSMTVPVRRGGIFSLMAPIPPATITMQGSAIVHSPGSPLVRAVTRDLAPLLPSERRVSTAIIEIVPAGFFVTYGLGVSLMKMRDPAAASDRVPVDQAAGALGPPGPGDARYGAPAPLNGDRLSAPRID